MDDTLKRDELERVVAEIANNDDVGSYTLDVSDATVKGDGYQSFLTKVDVHGERRSLSLMFKCAPRNPRARQLNTALRSCYLREILFYETAYPAMLKFQKDHTNAEVFNSVPACFATSTEDGKELLVLENIKARDFRMWNRKVQMDDEHVSLVLRKYGMYHAVSFAMKHRDAQLFKEITKDMGNVYTIDSASSATIEMLRTSIGSVAGLFDAKDEVYNAVRNLEETFLGYLKEFEVYVGKHSVITHGDCWCNNLMFAYENPDDSNRPTDLRLLDFQLVKPLSPVTDISTFFYSSASKQMLDNLDHYLQVYHESLAEHLCRMGCDVKDMFPFADLKAEWSKYAKFGLIRSLVTLKTMLRDDDEIVDFQCCDFVDSFGRDIRNAELKKRQRDLILHAYDIEII